MDVEPKGQPEFVKKDFPDPKPTCTLCNEKTAIVGLESEKRKGLWLCDDCLGVVTKWCFMLVAKAANAAFEDEDATKH